MELRQLRHFLALADLADDAARYSFAGERGVAQQAGCPPSGDLDEPLAGELPEGELVSAGVGIGFAPVALQYPVLTAPDNVLPGAAGRRRAHAAAI
jgi:hypothetical protein